MSICSSLCHDCVLCNLCAGPEGEAATGASAGGEGDEGEGEGEAAAAPASRKDKKRKRVVTASEEERAGWRLEAQKAPVNALLHLRTHGADCLVMVIDSHPLPLLLQTLRYLKPSSPFAVFSRLLEPLAECFRQLKHYGMATRMAVSETWTRHYQVRGRGGGFVARLCVAPAFSVCLLVLVCVLPRTLVRGICLRVCALLVCVFSLCVPWHRCWRGAATRR